jgi:hypothetical protein
LRPRVKRLPIYAIDMGEGAGSPTYDPTTAGGVSPSWTLPDGVRAGVTCDIMVPHDRMPGADIAFYFVYAPIAMGGTGNVVLGIDYALYRDDVYHGGLGLNPARTVRVVVDTPPFGVVMKRTEQPVKIPGADLDRREQIQMQFIRAGDLAEDTDNRNIYLFKVIMEYLSVDKYRSD